MMCVRRSPDLSDGHSDSLRIRLARGFSNYALAVESHITSRPDSQTHAGAQPERFGGVALVDTVDTSLTADVVLEIADIHNAEVILRLACPSIRNNGFWVSLEALPTR